MLLLIKKIKFKKGKLILKFISLFKIFKYIKELAYIAK
jgi:putative sterol carrier protein